MSLLYLPPISLAYRSSCRFGNSSLLGPLRASPLGNQKRLRCLQDQGKFQTILTKFQDALTKSNEVFETFKQEIGKMAKSIKDLKKENLFLKSKCDKTDVTLIELVDERERLKKQLEKTKNQKEKLESLCHSLQAERKQNSIDDTSNNSSDPIPS